MGCIPAKPSPLGFQNTRLPSSGGFQNRRPGRHRLKGRSSKGVEIGKEELGRPPPGWRRRDREGGVRLLELKEQDCTQTSLYNAMLFLFSGWAAGGLLMTSFSFSPVSKRD